VLIKILEFGQKITRKLSFYSNKKICLKNFQESEFFDDFIELFGSFFA